MRHVASGKSIDVSPTCKVEEFSINPGGCVQYLAYFGQENGIGQWVVLEVLQNANSFDLTSVTTDERFSKLARVGLGQQASARDCGRLDQYSPSMQIRCQRRQ